MELELLSYLGIFKHSTVRCLCLEEKKVVRKAWRKHSIEEQSFLRNREVFISSTANVWKILQISEISMIADLPSEGVYGGSSLQG